MQTRTLPATLCFYDLQKEEVVRQCQLYQHCNVSIKSGYELTWWQLKEVTTQY